MARQPHWVLCSLVGMTVALGTPAFALDEELLRHPVPTVVAYYQQNEASIDALRKTLAESTDTAERLNALNKLVSNFPDAAIITARKYVNDKNNSVAGRAVGYLMNELVMTDHQHNGTGKLLPRIEYMMEIHQKGRDALRKAVSDERPEIREPAATFFASQSDVKALDMVAKGVETGLYSDEQAASLFSLSRGPVGLKYIERYLGQGSKNAQAIAVGYAGFYPKYQNVIRERYFANASADTDIRVVAASTLSKYDPRFAEYALVVANEQNVSPALYSTTVRGYIDTQVKKDRLDKGSAKLLELQIKNFTSASQSQLSDAISRSFKQIQQDLKAYSGSE